MPQLYYREIGKGEPLIILHGLLGSGDNWQRIAKQFSENYRVILPDARNHGRSPHTDSISYPEMAEDLRLLCRSLNIAKAHFIGHSMGGKTLMVFADKYPQIIKKLIIVDVTPSAYSANNFAAIFAALNAVDPAKVSSRQEAEAQVAGHVDNPLIRGFILKNLARAEGGGFRWKINLPLIENALPDISGQINIDIYREKALFIAGGKSDYISPERREQLKQTFPRGQVVTIPNAGHWVHYEASRAFASIVERYLTT